MDLTTPTEVEVEVEEVLRQTMAELTPVCKIQLSIFSKLIGTPPNKCNPSLIEAVAPLNESISTSAPRAGASQLRQTQDESVPSAAAPQEEIICGD